MITTLVVCFIILPCMCFICFKYCGDDEEVGVKRTEETIVVEEIRPDGTKKVTKKKREVIEDDDSSSAGYTSSSYESERQYVDHKGRG